jgi:hypothetical protein
MTVQQRIDSVLIALYAIWLIAGALDYLCHRATDIAHTTGARESVFHVGQFLSIAIALVLFVSQPVSAGVFAVMIAAIAIHTVLSAWDIAYTQGRRYISVPEQHAHALMQLLPVFAITLLGVLHWEALSQPIEAGSHWLRSAPSTTRRNTLLLLGSYFGLAGVCVAEEFIRTLRQHGGLKTGATTAGR